MTTGVEVVTYDGLPAAAGGAHSLRTKKPDVARAKVHEFVTACARPMSTPRLTFEVWSGGPADVTERLTAYASEHLGGARSRAGKHTEWGVRADAVDATLAVLADAGPDAVTQYGQPIASLVWSAEVLLIDPATDAPYEGIGPDDFGRFAVDGYGRRLGLSGVRAMIGTTASSLSLWINLPGDDRLSAAASHLQDHLPFRLSAKHWRRWVLARDGSSYRAKKIPSPLAG